VELEPQRRRVLIMGALAGAALGAGTLWLLSQSQDRDPEQPKRPIRIDEVIRLVSQMAGLIRNLDDVRRRL
jgi:hypothetical protein